MPRAITFEEILQQTIRDFGEASTNALRAGFDGVEIHGANGYLLDRFSNRRQDDYGDNVENRFRLLDEVIRAVAEAIAPKHVGLRLSPWSAFQGMRMGGPIPQITEVIKKACQADIAYLHLV